MTHSDSGDQKPQQDLVAVRLRGLAALLRAVSAERLQELTNLDEVTFYIASQLDDMAEALGDRQS